MKEHIGVIVVAAGHGTVRPGVSKLVETVDVGWERSMIGTVLRTVEAVPQVQPAYLVLNGRFGGQIGEAIARDAPRIAARLRTVHQQVRRGAADAVAVALMDPAAASADAYLVVYGDMPLWRPETLTRLIELHQTARPRPVISMVTVRIGGVDSPRVLERYGRVFRDARGRIVNVVEPGDGRLQDVATTATVNPSLYVFNRSWFLAHLRFIQPYPRADGHGDELHLPPFLMVAAVEEAPVAELELDDPEEALGVNTAAELDEARLVLARRTMR